MKRPDRAQSGPGTIFVGVTHHDALCRRKRGKLQANDNNRQLIELRVSVRRAVLSSRHCRHFSLVMLARRAYAPGMSTGALAAFGAYVAVTSTFFVLCFASRSRSAASGRECCCALCDADAVAAATGWPDAAQ